MTTRVRKRTGLHILQVIGCYLDRNLGVAIRYRLYLAFKVGAVISIPELYKSLQLALHGCIGQIELIAV